MVLVTGAVGSGSDGFGANVLADGAAFGTDTFASVDISATAVDGTYADAVSAAVMVTSAAQSPDADAAALATAVAELIGDASVMIGITHTSSMTVTDGQSQTNVAVAFASVDALQFDTAGTGDVAQDTAGCGCEDPGTDMSAPESMSVTASEDSIFNGADLDGNLTTFDVAANAFGDNSVADVTLDATAFEDQFSGVTAVVFVVVE
jgi:hypothetical protein